MKKLLLKTLYPLLVNFQSFRKKQGGHWYFVKRHYYIIEAGEKYDIPAKIWVQELYKDDEIIITEQYQ